MRVIGRRGGQIGGKRRLKTFFRAAMSRKSRAFLPGGSLSGARTQATFLRSSALRSGLAPVPASASAQLAFSTATRQSEFAAPNRSRTIASQIGPTQVASFSSPNYSGLLSRNGVTANTLPFEHFSMGRMHSMGRMQSAPPGTRQPLRISLATSKCCRFLERAGSIFLASFWTPRVTSSAISRFDKVFNAARIFATHAAGSLRQRRL